MTKTSAGDRTALYRFYASDDALLYVGITERLSLRWEEHARAQTWWPQVDHQTVQWLPSRERAFSAEKDAIAAENPAFNIVGAARKGCVRDERTGFYVAPKRVPRFRPQHYDVLPLMYHGDGLQWPHERVARKIEGAIISGEFPPGSKLPSQRHMADEAGVSEHTVSAAVKLLAARGTLYTRSRLGTFVAGRASG
jgi:predicted GIY-YIG superfamily endonuclease